MKLRSKLMVGCGLFVLFGSFISMWGLTIIWPTLKVGTAFKAKNLCSSVFVSGRDPDWVNGEDLSFGPLVLVTGDVDREDKTAGASVFGMAGATAVYREGLGCTIVNGGSLDHPATVDTLKKQAAGFAPPKKPDMTSIAWPQGELVPPGPPPALANPVKLDEALKYAFAEPDPPDERRTRAILVVHDGRIIAEQYSKGITKDTPLGGYSMTKSVTSALVGILVRQGRLNVKAPLKLPEWDSSVSGGKYKANAKKGITLDHFLRMSSGLEFNEDYDDYSSDVVVMLYRVGDAGSYAASKKARVDPDTEWQYSSGTTNIISNIIRRNCAPQGSNADYWNFPRRELFEKIGMHSTTMEPDASGAFVGSSFMYSTARDWARFGLLYLNDGVWNGERILPEGWVKYSTTPTPRAPKGEYGAQWWLNSGAPDDPAKRELRDVPRDAFMMSGYEGQMVLVIPSRKIVMVRLGQSRPFGAFDRNTFASLVLEAIGQPKGEGE